MILRVLGISILYTAVTSCAQIRCLAEPLGVCITSRLTLIDFMFRDLLQKMSLRTSRLETQAWSSHPGRSSLSGGGPGGNANTVDYSQAIMSWLALQTGNAVHVRMEENPCSNHACMHDRWTLMHLLQQSVMNRHMTMHTAAV